MADVVYSLEHHRDIVVCCILLPKQQCWAEQALLADTHTVEVGWEAGVEEAEYEVAGMHRQRQERSEKRYSKLVAGAPGDEDRTILFAEEGLAIVVEEVLECFADSCTDIADCSSCCKYQCHRNEDGVPLMRS